MPRASMVTASTASTVRPDSHPGHGRPLVRRSEQGFATTPTSRPSARPRAARRDRRRRVRPLKPARPCERRGESWQQLNLRRIPPFGNRRYLYAGSVSGRAEKSVFRWSASAPRPAGLSALTQLLAALPPRPGLALVVVQHLDPQARKPPERAAAAAHVDGRGRRRARRARSRPTTSTSSSRTPASRSPTACSRSRRGPTIGARTIPSIISCGRWPRCRVRTPSA